MSVDKLTQLEQIVLDIDRIEVGTCGFRNDRTALGDLSGLVDSIKAKGLIEPPVVWFTAQEGQEHYVLIAGHRRLEALKLIRAEEKKEGQDELSFTELVCTLHEGDLESASIVAALENIQRNDLNSADTAEAVSRLVTKTGNQVRVAQVLGKSQAWVSNCVVMVRSLIPDAFEAFRADRITHRQAISLARMLNQDKSPDFERQATALTEMLAGVDAEEGSASEKSKDKEAKPKTLRSRKEIEALSVTLSTAQSNDPDVEVEYRRSLGRFIDWVFCKVETEDVLFGAAVDHAQDDEPIVETETYAKTAAPEPDEAPQEAPPVTTPAKRRLSQIKAG